MLRRMAMSFRGRGAVASGAIIGATAIALSACASGPKEGPTRHEVEFPAALEYVERFVVTENQTDGYTTIYQNDERPIDSGQEFPPTLVLDASLEKLFGGKNVRVAVEARSSESNGSTSLTVQYATMGGDGRSAGNEFALSTEFQKFEFEYLVPVSVNNVGRDGIYLLPSPPGTAVDIKRISVSVAQ
jgi:hypothetical protein